MTSTSCPDDLENRMLDERRGTLSREEGAALAAHAAICATCRMARALGRVAGPLPPIDPDDEALAARLVARAVAPRAVTGPGGRSRAKAVSASARRARNVSAVAPRARLPRWVTVAAAFALMAGVASAAVWTGRRLFPSARVEPRSIPAEARAARALPSASGPGPAGQGEAEPVIATARTQPPPPAEAPAVADRESVSSDRKPERPRAFAAPLRGHGAPPPVAAVEPSAAPSLADPLASTETPDGLLRAANQARSARRLDEAIHGYEDLQSRFPASREAVVSRLSLGDLALSRGAFALALAAFDAYLASGATELGEEALIGKARALAGLGLADEEREAWRTLEARYPSSEYRWRARQRLRELGGERAP